MALKIGFGTGQVMDIIPGPPQCNISFCFLIFLPFYFSHTFETYWLPVVTTQKPVDKRRLRPALLYIILLQLVLNGWLIPHLSLVNFLPFLFPYLAPHGLGIGLMAELLLLIQESVAVSANPFPAQ